MFQNYLKLALRNLGKDKFFSALNILGLSVGLACCMLFSLHISEETNFDRHHPRAQDLYRVGTTFLKPLSENPDDREMATFNTPAPLGDFLKREFGEIEKTARLQKIFSHEKTPIRWVENGKVAKSLNEPNGYFADSTFFEMFRFDFAEGNPSKALAQPNTMVISEELARKIFGDRPASGQILRVSNNWFDGGELDFTVSGVFRKPAAPTAFEGNFFLSLYSGNLGRYVSTNTNLVNNNMFSTYLLLQHNADGKILEAKLPAFVEKHMGEALKKQGWHKHQFLTRVPDVHLSGVGQKSIDFISGSKTYLYILGSVAIFTLLIACVNFINLSTARAARRTKEVGVRKAVGANKSDLMRQFLGESLLISLISWVLALGLTQVLLPFFSRLTEQDLDFSAAEKPVLFAGFFGLALLTGGLAGIYPAFYLSSFQPTAVLKGPVSSSFSAAFLRKGLVVFQFVISVGLILASLVIGRQMRFLQSADLGFQKEQQIVLPLMSSAAVAAFEPLKNNLLGDHRVEKVGASLYYPGIQNLSDVGLRREGQAVELAVLTRRNFVDCDFLQTLKFKPVAGRLFSPDFPTDTVQKLILNETAVRKCGFESAAAAVGQKVVWTYQTRVFRYEILGVVKDFHFENLHEPIQSYAFELNREQPLNYLIARAEAGCDLAALLAGIEQIWHEAVPGEPLEYSFLDEDFQKNYKSDRLMGSLVGSLTGIAILISCLGLFGLAAFAAQQRTKEIGIRKVLGASVAGITGLLAKDFLKLVLIAILISSPIAYHFMTKWLADFAYRIDIQWWMFALAGLVAILVAFLTVGFQSVKAALTNPVKSLRSE
jgi:putative ABC transport system permease protein